MLLRRPRNVNSVRAASILYGDWDTSKAARNRMVRFCSGGTWWSGLQKTCPRRSNCSFMGNAYPPFLLTTPIGLAKFTYITLP